jgi:hypothetical protein
MEKARKLMARRKPKRLRPLRLWVLRPQLQLQLQLQLHLQLQPQLQLQLQLQLQPRLLQLLRQ